ncbi:hypothetical protein [Roseibium sp.]|uniref:hypothetical protein n=1 Tax=Roseibium sp. TaxID=1936156 RepID=UPI003A9779D8
MRQVLPERISILLTGLALVAFLVAGGSFNHSLAPAGHSHAHESVAGGDHQHLDDGGQLLTKLPQEVVHCGASLLALVVDAFSMVAMSSADISFSLSAGVTTAPGSVDPPPPRRFS